MTMTKRELVESYRETRDFYWGSFVTRRTAEWRVTMALGALTLGAVGLIQKADSGYGVALWIEIIISSVVWSLFFVFCFFHHFLSVGNRMDQRMAWEVQELINKAVGHEWADDTARQLQVIRQRKWPFRNWAVWTHYSIGFFLCLLLQVFIVIVS